MKRSANGNGFVYFQAPKLTNTANIIRTALAKLQTKPTPEQQRGVTPNDLRTQTIH